MGQRRKSSGWVRLRNWLIRQVALHAPASRKYKGAWLVIDRDTDANDCGEAFYRWLRRQHPEVNAWFMLRRTSQDWKRLESEGFRLVAFGTLQWKMAVLNASHVISSQITAYVTRPLPKRFFRDLMRWRFTFLQHGVIYADLSRWLNNNGKMINLMVTTSPAEHRSVIHPTSRYRITPQKVARTGLPRFDYLYGLRHTEPEFILVAPTWRHWLTGNLVNPTKGTRREINREFEQSEFIQRWLASLHDEGLRDFAFLHGLRIMFFPHPALEPYLHHFNLPGWAEVRSHSREAIKDYLPRSAALLTDYSSIAFDMAFLRRPTVYYQFDVERYFESHTMRRGYFNFERNGFGPVVSNGSDIPSALNTALFDQGAARRYRRRMSRAIPERDGNNCQRLYSAMVERLYTAS